MINYTLIHPDILAAVARAGHHSKILIADGNFPAATQKGPHATVVNMNLCPGVITCNQALQVMLDAVAVEAVHTMDYQREGEYALTEDPPVWNDYRTTLKAAGSPLDLEPLEEWAFYDAVMTSDHALTGLSPKL